MKYAAEMLEVEKASLPVFRSALSAEARLKRDAMPEAKVRIGKDAMSEWLVGTPVMMLLLARLSTTVGDPACRQHKRPGGLLKLFITEVFSSEEIYYIPIYGADAPSSSSGDTATADAMGIVGAEAPEMYLPMKNGMIMNVLTAADVLKWLGRSFKRLPYI